MNILENQLIAPLTTMKIGLGRVKFLITITSVDQIPQLYQFAQEQNLPVIILGEGSNAIAPDKNLEAIIVLNRIKGIHCLTKNANEATYKAFSGEQLDDLVDFTAKDNLSGIEALSGIPGTVGAAPIQNVGAYGQEISSSMIELEAFDIKTGEFVILTNQECNFSYRNSIFKQQAGHKYFIISITIKLTKTNLSPPFYTSLQQYIEQNQLTDFSPYKLRQYILEIRKSKIPDYKIYPSAGSFFQNALVSQSELDSIKKNHPNIPFIEPVGQCFKIPSGWLIEQAKLKGQLFNGMRVDKQNALILINETAKSHQDLTKAKKAINQIIYTNFKIKLKQEPIDITI